MLIDLLWLVVLVPATIMLPRIWRGRPQTTLDAVPTWWLWGSVLWSAVRRIIPLAIVLGWVGLVITLLPITTKGPEALTDAELAFGAALTVVVMLIALLMFAIVLFNRPHLLVPPRWRSEAGLVARWLRSSSK